MFHHATKFCNNVGNSLSSYHMMNCHEEDDEKANFVPFSSMEKLYLKIEKQMTTMKKKNEKMKKWKNSKMKLVHKEGMVFFSH